MALGFQFSKKSPNRYGPHFYKLFDGDKIQTFVTECNKIVTKVPLLKHSPYGEIWYHDRTLMKAPVPRKALSQESIGSFFLASFHLNIF